MGIANEFTFGGVSTADYGLVVEGPGNYSAPTRAVEVINIPGRDGAFVLDKGYYENVPAEFNVVAKGATQSDFKDIISAFRNAIVSQKGYVRLEELYQPGEYRMARYAGGFDEDPTFHGNGAIFKVKFDCKPQRYLTDGETAVSVEDGDTLTNPTLFEAHPLLEVEGYGTNTVNGYEITINDEEIGELELVPATKGVTSYNGNYYDDSALVEDGDTMMMGNFTMELDVRLLPVSTYIKVVSAVFSSRGSRTIPNYIGVDTTKVSDQEIKKRIKYGEQSFVKQNTTVTYTDSCRLAITLEKGDGTRDTFNYDFDIEVRNYGATGTAPRRLQIRRANISGLKVYFNVGCSIDASAFIAVSTQSVLGHPTYIDCEIGEAYKIIGSRVLPLNRYIALGSKLPELSPGDNEIEVSGATTSLEIVPRWWKV